MTDKQPDLFSYRELQQMQRPRLGTPKALEMSSPSLKAWKQRISEHQRQVRTSLGMELGMEQGSLFDLGQSPSNNKDPIAHLDPFSLRQQSMEFWRWPVDEPGVAALYFVIDYSLPLLLYIGETCHSNQRWKGEHDCKRYIQNYQSLHTRHSLYQVAKIGIAFWLEAPLQTRPRQQMESALIHRWRSPFNKENWEFWGTPFIH